jgi:lysylphosphatidylglycerol synthetase-like protein (DUF2156 family)/membrane associated rhomboid family serine protease
MVGRVRFDRERIGGGQEQDVTPPATTPAEPTASGRWRSWSGAVRRQLAQARRAPVTALLVVVIWAAGAATGSLLNGPSDELRDLVAVGVPTLTDGAWWTPLTSAFFADDLVTYLLVTMALLVVGSLCERRWGSARMAGIALLVQVVGVGAGVGAVALADAAVDWQWADYLAASVAVGATPLVAGLLMAFSAGSTVLWRRRIRVGVFTLCLVALLYGGQLQDVLRMSAALIGLLAGVAFAHRGDRRIHLHASRHETRVLVAVVVAATALGPILIAVTGEIEGPLSALADLYVGPSAYGNAGTDRDLAQILLSVVPALIVLVLAAGLRRGRRFAWWATLVFHTLLLTVGAFYAVDYYQWAIDNDLIADSTNWVAWLIPLVLLPVLIIGLLLATRRSFTVQAPAGVYRRLGLIVAGLVAGLWVVFVALGSLVADDFDPPVGVADLVVDFPARLLPNGYLSIIEPAFEPTDGLGRFLADWIPVAVWTVVLVGLMRSFVSARVETADGDRIRAQRILQRHGTSSLSHLTTWAGNSYWFAPSGRTFVAYRVEGGVAITTGDPVGPPEDRQPALDAFVEFCGAHHWTVCLYSVTEAVKHVTDGYGWPSLQVAEETVLPLGSLAFTGKKFQDIRTSISRAGKSGITAEWITYRSAPLSIRDQIEAISEEWVSDKALPEMGFTLGGLDELEDPAVRCLIAVDAERTIHGVTSWMPCYSDGEPIGWTLDFMRRRTGAAGEGFKGVMEFLIGTAALDLQAQGAQFLSLSGAPLAQAHPDDDQAGVQRLLQVIGATMEPVYGFRSLLRFKAKFQPDYRPMYLCYPEAAVLPRIGLAISRAYLPNMTVRQGVRMMGQLT